MLRCHTLSFSFALILLLTLNYYINIILNYKYITYGLLVESVWVSVSPRPIPSSNHNSLGRLAILFSMAHPVRMPFSEVDVRRQICFGMFRMFSFWTWFSSRQFVRPKFPLCAFALVLRCLGSLFFLLSLASFLANTEKSNILIIHEFRR